MKTKPAKNSWFLYYFQHMKNGRPTKLNSKLKKQISDCLKEGMSYKDACKIAGISFETFAQYRKKFSDFSDLIERSELKHKELALSSMRKGMKKDWRAAAWWLERRYPDEYKEKKEIKNDIDLPKLVVDI